MARISLAVLSIVAGLPLAAWADTQQDDEASIRQIVLTLEADEPDPHVAANLDWENAFGIRYNDLKKRDAFYGAVVKPQFKTASDNTLEIRVQFVTPLVAVADTYWHVAGQIYAGDSKPGPDRWGRTTYILKKDNGAWREVIERVADLRLPYYPHLDTVPKAVELPAAVLASYAGHYAGPPYDVDVTVSGDHLVMTGPHGALIAIPKSETEFLAFLSPDDPAQYYTVQFEMKDDAMRYTVHEAWGDAIKTQTKKK